MNKEEAVKGFKGLSREAALEAIIIVVIKTLRSENLDGFAESIEVSLKAALEIEE